MSLGLYCCNMSTKINPETPDQFNARKRRERRDATRLTRKKKGPKNAPQKRRANVPEDGIYLYGIHSVRAALENPNRQHKKLFTTAKPRDYSILYEFFRASL